MDAGVQHRGRRAPRRHLRGRHRRRPRPWSSPSRCSRRCSARAGRCRRPFTGADMERWTYQRPFELVEFPAGDAGAHFVVLADYVTTEDGTGLVHQSPAFGEDDLAVCRALRPAGGQPGRGPTGTSTTTCRWSAASSSSTPTPTWSRTSSARGLLFRHVPYEHSYPHCWRCHTAAACTTRSRPGTSAPPQVKDALLRENEKTNWYPETIKWGRYGDWLHNNIDWALSRSRYWGTPLPIWRCAEGHQTCVGSLAELSELDRHRPVRPRPAPPVRRRRRPSPARDVRRQRGAPGARGHRRLVRLGLDAVRAVGLPARRRARRSVRAGLPGASSSARRSTRPAAGSTR